MVDCTASAVVEKSAAASQESIIAKGGNRRSSAGVSSAADLMHIPRWFIWLLLFAAATFCWIVFFEYGTGEERFRHGAEKEWARMWIAVREWLGSLRGS
jgi:hypothetical protein